MRRPVPTRLAALALIVTGAAADAAPAIHLNQIGFLPDGPKRAVVTDPATTPLPWVVLDAGGGVVATGETVVTGDDAASGDHLHQVGFDRVTAPGTYRLRVGGTTSRPFAVAADLYAPLASAALNYFYQTRAGIAIEARHAGGKQWARAAGHPNEIVPCFSGADTKGNVWPGCNYTRNVTGGWYDAGDQGKYVVNGGISLWTLLNLYELNAARPPFADGTAKLPEAGNDINDLLDEARWEMDFLLAMQAPDGARAQVPVGPQPAGQKLTMTAIDASGMAHHKVADRNWTGIPTIPAEDREDRLLYPPTTAATLNLAATAAQGARVWKTIDPAYSTRCLEAAKRAYAAALRNPRVYAPETFTGSGSYGDTALGDEFYWATAELFATTGDAQILAALKRLPPFADPVSEPGWGGVAALGTITLATVPTALAPAEQAKQRALIVAAADRYVAEAAQTGYRLPYASLKYDWGSNSAILNRAMILGLAARFTSKPAYRTAEIDAMDYVLGRNPIDQSYVSGFGWKPLRNPHHRFWAHEKDPRLPGPPPGVVSGGPNSGASADGLGARLKGCAPQRCWRDSIDAYELNEVTINWNAPLLWIAADLAMAR
ncbi:glycosyl hydrolase [Sphingomonas sp. Leaf17]|uniref:glycoside hydrolase family 9 protein n=1 Tax=Sphingomonas sp. Leaf17 TaxID=1735683 RepID=UPI0006FABBF4|nr:glycoside hydrolase family 9 protein [Sphingomonas sp. Leaf17]KQM64228.1 glycosyl hydrolase [Sphingomonas sp. Leaf17]